MRLIFLIVFISSLLLTSCVKQPTTYFHAAKDVDLSQYRTFNVVSILPKEEVESNEADLETFNALKAIIVKELSKKGYVQTSKNADFVVVFIVDIEDARRLYTVDSPGLKGHYQTMYSLMYSKGKVIIDALDNKQQTLIWRGALKQNLKPRAEIVLSTLEDITREILTQFPTP